MDIDFDYLLLASLAASLLDEIWTGVRASDTRDSYRAPHFEWDLNQIDDEVCRRETR
jgi:hypothetical protein